MFKFIIATLCIACCIDYNEATRVDTRESRKKAVDTRGLDEKAVAKEMQWYKLRELGTNENLEEMLISKVKEKAKEKAEENVESSAKRKLYNEAFEFYILPIDKKRSKLVDTLSSKTTTNMLVEMYSLISGTKKDDLISEINKSLQTDFEINLSIMTNKKQNIKEIINGLKKDMIENLSNTLIKKTFGQLGIKEKQDWLIDKLKKRSGIKMLNDAYKPTKIGNTDIKTEIQNVLGINVGKTKKKQIKEVITHLEEETLNRFFEKIQPKEKKAEMDKGPLVEFSKEKAEMANYKDQLVKFSKEKAEMANYKDPLVEFKEEED